MRDRVLRIIYQVKLAMERSIRVISRRESYNAKFNAKQINLTVQLLDNSEIGDNVNFFDWYISWFDQLISLVTNEFSPRDYIGMKISVSDDDASKSKAIGLPLREIETLSGEIIADLLSNVMQSNESYSHADKLDIEATIIRHIANVHQGQSSLVWRTRTVDA